MRARAKSTFDDLQQRVERKRQRFSAMIQAAEDKMALKQQNEVRAAITSQAGVLENLLQSAADDVLLDMVLSQESRLQQLQQQMTSIDSIQDPADVSVDGRQLTQLVAALDALGRQAPPPPTPPSPSSSSSTPPRRSAITSTSTPTKPRGAALARVLKVGDRVKLNPEHKGLYLSDKGRQGTVMAIPSRWMSARGKDPTGCVDVQWDNGRECCHCMGWDGLYHLDLV